MDQKMRKLRLDSAVEWGNETSPAIVGAESLIHDVDQVPASDNLPPWDEVLDLKQETQTPSASTGTGGDWEMVSPSKHSACGSSTRSMHGSECGDASEAAPDNAEEALQGPEGPLEGPTEEPLHMASDISVESIGSIHSSASVADIVELMQQETAEFPEDPLQGPAEGPSFDEGPMMEGKTVTAAHDMTHVGLTWVMSWFTSPGDMDSCKPQMPASGIQAYFQQFADQVRTYLPSASYMTRDWTKLGLGAGVLLLGTLLASSYLKNRKLTDTLRSRDREVAKLVMKILSMQDTLQGRRFPIVRHTAWAALPAELM